MSLQIVSPHRSPSPRTLQLCAALPLDGRQITLTNGTHVLHSEDERKARTALCVYLLWCHSTDSARRLYSIYNKSILINIDISALL